MKNFTRYSICTAVALALTCATPALAATEVDCAASWKTADANSDGVISGQEGERYVAAMRVANKTVPEKGLDQAGFDAACKEGVFNAAKTDAGAPLKGANSFTEAQAKDRVVGAGMTGVSELKKDADGIWRGTASDGKATKNVAVDFKGNVVAN